MNIGINQRVTHQMELDVRIRVIERVINEFIRVNHNFSIIRNYSDEKIRSLLHPLNINDRMRAVHLMSDIIEGSNTFKSIGMPQYIDVDQDKTVIRPVGIYSIGTYGAAPCTVLVMRGRNIINEAVVVGMNHSCMDHTDMVDAFMKEINSKYTGVVVEIDIILMCGVYNRRYSDLQNIFNNIVRHTIDIIEKNNLKIKLIGVNQCGNHPYSVEKKDNANSDSEDSDDTMDDPNYSCGAIIDFYGNVRSFNFYNIINRLQTLGNTAT